MENSLEEADKGDATLLETMLAPFFLRNNSAKTDLNVPNILCTEDEKLEKYDLHHKCEEVGVYPDVEDALEDDDVLLEVIYERKGPHRPALTDTEYDFSTVLHEPAVKKKPPFHLSQNANYRKFMEELILVKCCSKEILQLIDDVKRSFIEHIEIQNDPGFGNVHSVQGWLWILREAIILSYQAARRDRGREKYMSSFLAELFSSIDTAFKFLRADVANLVLTYNKVAEEFNLVGKKSTQRFCFNLKAARDYELNTSGFNFFLQQSTGSAASMAECEGSSCGWRRANLKTSQRKEPAVPPERAMSVRCGVDGITIRSGKSDSRWLKFQSIDQDRDKQSFLKIFGNTLCDRHTKIRRTITLMTDYLEARHKSGKGSAADSVMQSLLKCKEIVDKSRKAFPFYPREEVMMLFSLKAARAAFNLIKPLLIELEMMTGKVVQMVSMFCHDRKSLKDSSTASRIPISGHSVLEMQVEDTRVNIQVILNRYPNLREARQMRDKLLGQSSSNFLNEPSPFDDELPIEILYKRPLELHLSPSAEEMIESFREYISDETHDTSNPNPAPFLFADVQEDYRKLAATLMETRKITMSMVELCSDPIQNMYYAAREIAQAKEKIAAHLIHATENLNYTENSSIQHCDRSKHTPLFFWIQIICKLVHVWDFNSLPRHLQNHFRAVNETSLHWLQRLDETYGKVVQIIKQFKQDFQQFHNYIEEIHVFSTWVRKRFRFHMTEEIIAQWIQEDAKEQISEMDTYTTISPLSGTGLQLEFQGFDLDFCQLHPDKPKQTLLSLNKSTSTVQVGLATVLHAYLDTIISRVIINLNSAYSILENNLNIKNIKKPLSTESTMSSLAYLRQLEELVFALTFEMIYKNVKEITSFMSVVGNSITQYKRMFETVQLHMEDRGILQAVVTVETLRGRPRTSHKLARKIKAESEHYHHDVYLNETIQLVRSSVDAMPNIFEIQEDSLSSRFMHWLKLAERDAILMTTIHPPAQLNRHEGIMIRSLNKQEYQEEVDIRIKDGANEESPELPEISPIDFDEAMAMTTTGKAFFPDPFEYTFNIEYWRTICFKMLATALDKFRDMATTKIIDLKKTLSIPRLSQHKQFTEALDVHESSDEILKDSQTISTEKRNSSDNHFFSVGYTEGLCSLLCFCTRQLSLRDRALVTGEDVKNLKDNFYSVTTLVEKFKKDLDSTEKVLVNSLSLAMASVEYKRLPHHLPVLPLEIDFLKNHDLEEIGTTGSKRKDTSVNDDNFSNSEGPFEDTSIELQWESSNRDKLFCKASAGDSSAWLDFSKLHISGQLRVIHIIIDNLLGEFHKARDLVKEAKADLTCAKKLLEKTWRGIGNDMKRGRIPDSGILVLVKLYRHQIAMAAINTKAVKKTAREVRFLLSQSAQIMKIWAADDIDRRLFSRVQTHAVVPNDQNYIMNQEDLSLAVTIKTVTPTEAWLRPDAVKILQEESVEATAEPLPYAVDVLNILDVQRDVEAKASSILDISVDLKKQLSELSVRTNVYALKAKKLAQSGQAEKDKKPIVSSGNDFFSIAASIENLLMSGLPQSVAILKLPNCSLSMRTGSHFQEKESVPNVVGVLTTLVGTALNFRCYKDISVDQRNQLGNLLIGIAGKVDHVNKPTVGLTDYILGELKKIAKSNDSFHTKFRRRFCFDGEFPRMDQIHVGEIQPIYGVTPIEFVESLAAAVEGHVWSVISGNTELGIVIKDNKTLESHALSNIPLSSQLEVLLSLLNFLDKLVEYAQTNLENTKKNVMVVKDILKSHGKALLKSRKHNSLIGMLRGGGGAALSNAMSKWEIEEYLQGFARISNACKVADDHLTELSGLFRSIQEIMQQVKTYVSLKFRVEPPGKLPHVEDDVISRPLHNWQIVDIAGLPHPPPVVLREKEKRAKRNASHLRYKSLWANKILELEMFLAQFCSDCKVAVEVPMLLAPVGTEEEQ